MLVGFLALLLGCAPEAWPPAQSADRSREDAVSRRPRVRIPVEREEVRKWTPEIATGECTKRDEGGAAVEITTVNVEGAPMLRLLADGGSYQWYRWRDADGVVRSAYVRWSPAGEAYGDVVIDERYDSEGRLVWRSPGPYRYEEWAYDAAGRVVRASEIGAESYVDRYTYGPDGQLTEHGYDRPSHDGYWRFRWLEGLLVEVRKHDTWGGVSELVWARHHASGLPEHGDGWWDRSDGNSGVWVEDWTYDDQGRPIGHSGGRFVGYGRRELWAWEGDRVVLYERYRLSQDGVEGLISREEWAWDDQGRIVWHDDEEARGHLGMVRGRRSRRAVVRRPGADLRGRLPGHAVLQRPARASRAGAAARRAGAARALGPVNRQRSVFRFDGVACRLPRS